MKDLSRPYLNIKKGTQPTDAYKQGKAIALLFVLDYLTHQAEGRCIEILNLTEMYLKKELEKLGVKLEVKTDEVVEEQTENKEEVENPEEKKQKGE